MWSRNVIRCSVDESCKTFSKIFILGVTCPKIWNRKSVKQAPHSEQATDHGMHCREIVFTPRCSPRARDFLRSAKLFCTTYGCGAPGRQSCPIFVFLPILPTQNDEKYRPVTSLKPRGCIAEWLRFFLPRVSTLTRDIDIPILSFRLSVCLSVCPWRSGMR